MTMMTTGWGPQDSVQLPYKWLNSMVFGRYNELVFLGGYSWFLNQRSHHWGAPACWDFFFQLKKILI